MQTALRPGNRLLAFIVAAGTLFRVLYGCLSKPWLGAADQLSWGLELDDAVRSGHWSYFQLTHAAHEGADPLISVLAILLRPLSTLAPPLTLAALLIDTVGRALQVAAARRLFGYETAVWFGIWTILSAPLLLPWSIVNFGLHGLLSFVPFLFCLIVIRYRYSPFLPAICGVSCAVAVSLSYNSLALLPASLFFLLQDETRHAGKPKHVFIFIAAFVAGMLPHILLRVLYEAAHADLLVRGLSFGTWAGSLRPLRLLSVWFTSLPGSLLLLPGMFVATGVILIGGLILYAKQVHGRALYWLPFTIVIGFVVMYALSPFYGTEMRHASYMYYRHLAYIVPLIMLMVIHGFVQLRGVKGYVLTVCLALFGFASLRYVVSSASPAPAYATAGWVLAQKYPVDKLLSIQQYAPTVQRRELVRGYGWGMAARLLDHDKGIALPHLSFFINGLREPFRGDAIAGVRHAFDKGITPVLEPSLLRRFDSVMAIQTLYSSSR